jgi:hypothetical protein
MIRDATALAEIRKNWAGVEALRTRLQVSAFSSVGVIRRHFPVVLSNAAHNLPFVHAFAVLNDVLKQLEDERHFNCNSKFLGPLLRASEKALPWRNFALVSAGVDRRNGVAHRGQLLDRGECWKYIDAVKSELSGWGIL